MGLAELFDEPQHARGPDAQRCSAADRPEAWAELTAGLVSPAPGGSHPPVPSRGGQS